MSDTGQSYGGKTKRPLWVRVIFWVTGIPLAGLILWWLFEYQIPKMLPVNF